MIYFLNKDILLFLFSFLNNGRILYDFNEMNFFILFIIIR